MKKSIKKIFSNLCKLYEKILSNLLRFDENVTL